jgi:Xaa-Pro aminopeptidase
MDEVRAKLVEAENKALNLFNTIERNGIIVAGKSERQLNHEIYQLAYNLFDIEKYWHKRIVRAGINTLKPYEENPTDRVIQNDDILFLDFGPVFEDWEADFGRTYVIGENPDKIKLKIAIEEAWYVARDWFLQQTKVTGTEYYHYIVELAKSYGYKYGGPLAGHLIGHFPHERLEPKNYGLYVHPENFNNMLETDKNGNKRHWILEIHFVDAEKNIGGFFEQLLA